MGYRLHTGGKWTGQYMVIDSEAYSQIPKGSGRSAYVHTVGEIYVPGSAGDDQDVHPTWLVAAGHLSEATPSEDESSEETVSNVEDLQTDIVERLVSSERPDNHKDLNNAGGVDIDAEDADTESGQLVLDQDSWAIEGDYLVRKHILPRTTLFSPLDCPEDPPPLEMKHIEVLRTAKPLFSGTPWPDLAAVEDCWMARPSDAKSLFNQPMAAH